MMVRVLPKLYHINLSLCKVCKPLNSDILFQILNNFCSCRNFHILCVNPFAPSAIHLFKLNVDIQHVFESPGEQPGHLFYIGNLDPHIGNIQLGTESHPLKFRVCTCNVCYKRSTPAWGNTPGDFLCKVIFRSSLKMNVFRLRYFKQNLVGFILISFPQANMHEEIMK